MDKFNHLTHLRTTWWSTIIAIRCYKVGIPKEKSLRVGWIELNIYLRGYVIYRLLQDKPLKPSGLKYNITTKSHDPTVYTNAEKSSQS